MNDKMPAFSPLIFLSYLIFEIFWTKGASCRPSWIIKDCNWNIIFRQLLQEKIVIKMKITFSVKATFHCHCQFILKFNYLIKANPLIHCNKCENLSEMADTSHIFHQISQELMDHSPIRQTFKLENDFSTQLERAS